MALEKIKPEVQRTDLGCVRMWQEDLAEIVRLTGKLPDVKLRIEADNYTLTDVVADLPGLGQNVSSFSVIAERRDADGEPHEVVRVKLANRGSHIEAADPDLDTLGLIGKIADIAKRRRRLPPKLKPLYDVRGSSSSSAGPLALLFLLLAGVPGVAYGIAAVQHLTHPHRHSIAPWPASILLSVPALLIVTAVCFGWYRARTTLYTAPHQAAPTWWERNRASVAITVVCSAIFLGIGWLLPK